MTASHGKSAVVLVVYVDPVTGPVDPTDISQYLTSVKLNTGRDAVNVTALGARYDNVIAGIDDVTLELEGIFDPVIDAIMRGVAAPNSQANVSYYPAGLSGNVYSGDAIRLDYDIPTDVESAVTWAATVHFVGALARA